REIERAGYTFGILWPANRPARHSLGPLDAKANTDVTGGAFQRGACPHVVPGGRAQAVFIFENVEANPVLVRKFTGRTWVTAHAGVDAHRIAEPEAKRVEVVNAHDAERHPALALLPGHPMRNGPHVDGRQHRLPQPAAVEDHLAGPYRLVVAHVLVHGQRDA